MIEKLLFARPLRWLSMSFAVAAFVLVLGGCASGRGTALLDEWALVSMGDARIGYVHTVTRELSEPQRVVVTSVFSESRLKRLGIAITIRTAMEFHETASGAMLSVTSKTYGSQREVVAHAVVHGDKMQITTETAGTIHTAEIPWDPNALGPNAQARFIRENALKPGGNAEFKVFLPEFQRVIGSRISVHGIETIDVGGEPVELWKGTMYQDVLPGIATHVWLDDDGNIVRSFTDLLGGVKTVKGTREQALAAIVPEQVADVMTRFFVQSNVEIQNPRDVKEILFRLEAAEDDLAALTLEDRRQTIENRSNGLVLLRVRALQNVDTPSGKAPGPEFLTSAPYVQSSDAEIKRLAKKAVGKALDPSSKALLLSKWVHENIRKKGLGVGFASAKEVALSREGDCTEHAVLLAALLRAEQIPSRVVVGLVYWQGVFGYHMWTEAFLDNWTALDATIGEGVVDATHIKFGDAALSGSSPADPFLSVVRVVGRMKLRVEEIR